MIGSNIKNIVFDMGRVLLDYDPALVARHAGASEEETALIKNTCLAQRNGSCWTKEPLQRRRPSDESRTGFPMRD